MLQYRVVLFQLLGNEALLTISLFSSGYPVNSFEFVKPLLSSLGYDLPNFYLPVPKALLLGKFFAALYTILYPWLDKWWLPHPLMLPAEIYKVLLFIYLMVVSANMQMVFVNVWMSNCNQKFEERLHKQKFSFTIPVMLLDNVEKQEFPIMFAYIVQVGVSNYFSYLKAKEELGYAPMVTPKEGMAATISFWQEKKRKSLDGPTIYVWLFTVVGMSILFCAAFLPDVGPVPFFKAISLFFFRSIQVVRTVFLVAFLLHVGEGIYAWFLARKVDPANSRGWFWQTFALGIFSLRFLLKRARN